MVFSIFDPGCGCCGCTVCSHKPDQFQVVMTNAGTLNGTYILNLVWDRNTLPGSYEIDPAQCMWAVTSTGCGTGWLVLLALPTGYRVVFYDNSLGAVAAWSLGASPNPRDCRVSGQILTPAAITACAPAPSRATITAL